jgi:hypothetical protein
VGRRPGFYTAEFERLIQELAQLSITMLFPLLAADVSWAELSPLGWGGILCVLTLMFVVRPIGVGVATIGLPLDLQQRLFLGWLAPERHRYGVSGLVVLHSSGTSRNSWSRPVAGFGVSDDPDDLWACRV